MDREAASRILQPRSRNPVPVGETGGLWVLHGDTKRHVELPDPHAGVKQVATVAAWVVAGLAVLQYVLPAPYKPLHVVERAATVLTQDL